MVIKAEHLVGGAAVLYLLLRGPDKAGQDIGAALSGAIGAVADAAAAVVRGAASAFGVPDPASDAGRMACCSAVREYDRDPVWGSLKAMTNCPLGEYLRWSRTGQKPSGCEGGGATGTW